MTERVFWDTDFLSDWEIKITNVFDKKDPGKFYQVFTDEDNEFWYGPGIDLFE